MSCIGNYEEKMDLSRIYLAVPQIELHPNSCQYPLISYPEVVSFIEKSDPSLYNLKLTCKQFSNMVRSEQIDEKRREENRKVKIFWERQPFPYIEAYRSYYSLYLPLD